MKLTTFGECFSLMMLNIRLKSPQNISKFSSNSIQIVNDLTHAKFWKGKMYKISALQLITGC